MVLLCLQTAVWLMAHQINPDEDDQTLIWPFLQEIAYGRERRSSGWLFRLDIVQRMDGTLIVSEVKKTSRHEKSATMQLLFYLKELCERGVDASGELRFPEERRRKTIRLTEATLQELRSVEDSIIDLITQSLPPEPVRIGLCRSCGYSEFCWS